MAGRFQREDFKTLAELLAAGGAKHQLLNDSQIYISADDLGLSLDEAILNGWIEPKTPLKIYASTPADSKLNIESTYVESIDGAKRILPTIRKDYTNFPQSTIDFQTQSTTGGTISITFPASTVGYFRRAVLAYTATATISVVFSAEFASLGSLPNPKTLFPSNTIPLGYIDLECTDVLGKFKTAGSITNIIENSVSGTARVFRVATGGVGGGGSGIYTDPSVTIADTATYSVGHGLQAPLSALKVLIRNVSGYTILSEAQKLAGYTLTNVDNDNFTIQNNTGSSQTIDIIVLGFKPKIISGTSPANMSDDLDPDFDVSWILGEHTKEPTGIETPTAWTLGFTDVSPARTFTATIAGTSNVWIAGVKYPQTGTLSLQISNTLGQHFIYFNAAGTLVESTTPWNLLTNAPVALVCWDGTKGILYDERHGITMDGATHAYLHETFHTQFVDGIELVAGSYALNSGTLNDVTPSFTDGHIRDEDIKLAITGFSGTNPTVWTPFYKTSADGHETWDSTPSQFMWKISGTNVVYNVFFAGNWILDIVPDTQYMNIWLLATDEYARGDASTPRTLIPIIGQALYTTLSDAQDVKFSSEVAISTLPSVEFLPCYHITIQCNTADAGNNYGRIAGIVDIRKVNNPGTPASGAGAHNTLSGRNDPSTHPASSIDTNTASFNGLLSNTDTTVQIALDTIDNTAVIKPASSTNRAIAIYSGTTGQVLLNSLVTIDTVGFIYTPQGLDSTGSVSLNIGTLASTDIFIGRSGQKVTILSNSLSLTEVASPALSSGYVALYGTTDHLLAYKNIGGDDIKVISYFTKIVSANAGYTTLAAALAAAVAGDRILVNVTTLTGAATFDLSPAAENVELWFTPTAFITANHDNGSVTLQRRNTTVRGLTVTTASPYSNPGTALVRLNQDYLNVDIKVRPGATTTVTTVFIVNNNRITLNGVIDTFTLGGSIITPVVNAGANGNINVTDYYPNTSYKSTFRTENVQLLNVPTLDGQIGVHASTELTSQVSGVVRRLSEVKDFSLLKIASPTLTVLGGQLLLSNGDTLVTGSGSTSSTTGFGTNLSLNLDTIATASGLSPVNNTTYYLYIDRYNLPAAAALSDNGNIVRNVSVVSADPTLCHFKLFATAPSATNPYRYVSLGCVRRGVATWSNIVDSTPTNSRDLMNQVYGIPQTATQNYTTAGVQTFTHNLAGEPDVIYLSYYDTQNGNKKNALDVATYVVDKNATNVVIDLTGLVFTGGDYVELKCVYLPQTGSQVVSLSNRFESGWITTRLATPPAIYTMPHGLTNMDDIRSYCVIEWDNSVPSAPVRRLIDPSALVISFDNTNFYLDFSSIIPTSTLMYNIISGGTPLPSALPIYLGGYTKFVGGIGGYTLLSDAIAASSDGDSILVTIPQSISADLVINKSNIRIEFMPNCPITTITNNCKVSITGNNVEIKRLEVLPTVAATTTGISIAGNDVFLYNALVKTTTGVTVTNAFTVVAGAKRTYINGKIDFTLGTISSQLSDSGTNGEFLIRG